MKDNDEKELIYSVESGEWDTIQNIAEFKQELIQAAKNTMKKDYRMNIRMSKNDIDALKTIALEDGLPYQTLVSSILHKYVTGRLIEA